LEMKKKNHESPPALRRKRMMKGDKEIFRGGKGLTLDGKRPRGERQTYTW